MILSFSGTCFAQSSSFSNDISITDHLGREVVIPQDVKRIVSGYYITTSMLIALGLDDNVVGIEAKANTRPIYALAVRITSTFLMSEVQKNLTSKDVWH